MLAFFFFGTLIIGFIISVLTEIGTFLSVILGFLLCTGLFALYLWIDNVWQKQSNQKRDEALADNTWKFPVAQFRNTYVALVGKIPSNIDKESDYQRAVIIAEIVLKDCGVNPQYYGRYTSRSALEQCFVEIAQNKGTYPTNVTYSPNEDELPKLQESRPIGREKDLIGRDKTIYHFEREIIACRREINEYEQNRNAIINGTNATYQLGKQRESSWAVHGGIASGIAGPAAGLATAIDIQNQNAATRQYNENLLRTTTQAAAPALVNIADALGRAEKRLESLKKSRTDATYKLVEFLDKKSLLTQLKPTVKIVNRSGNTVELKVTLHAVPDLVIYGDIPAAVDGSIDIRLRSNGYCVGTATCIFPFYGIRDQQVEISCSCRVTEVSDHYMFEFVPNHLWAIERP